MFIYAMARALAARSGAELVLDAVTGFTRDFKYQRRYLLDNFSPAGRLATPAERLEPWPRLRRSIWRKADLLRRMENKSFISEGSLAFDPRILTLRPRGSLYVEGYWQNEKYFEDYAEQIKAELAVQPELNRKQRALASEMRSGPSVAVHIRFFDDFSERGGREKVVHYYRKAMNVIERKEPQAIYYLFSDRPREALTLLEAEDRKVVCVENDDNDAATCADLWLIGNCRHAIIADSSFSWWGAWLGEEEDTIIVAPRFSLSSRDAAWGFEGLIPNRWQIIG